MSELHDLVALIRANTPLIVIETRDEARVVELFRQALMQVWRELYRWSITEGLRRLDFDREDPPHIAPDATNTFQAMRDAEQRGVYVLFDMHPYLGYAGSQRMLRDLVQRRDCQPHVIVLVGQNVELPPDLESLAVRFRPQLPDANARLKIVREEADNFARENGGRRVQVDTEAVQQIVRNLRGLDPVDVRRIARHLIFRDGALGQDDLPELAKLKFELLNRSGHLSYEYDGAHMDDVAGARRLKNWIAQRRNVFLAAEPPPGLDPPKGVLLLGVQGCGKSMLAKAVAAGFGVPLVRLDFGTLYDKFHGETEKNLRQALESVEQLEPCVLWIDEIEKGVSTDEGNGDGGVSRRVLGFLLTWMAERKSRVFLVATANQIDALPPELLRKGRFDEIFFVDLPTREAREQLFNVHMKKRGLDPSAFDIGALSGASEGFSGAEIEQAIVSGLYSAHAAGVALSDFTLRGELRNTRPLSVVMGERVAALRDWAQGRTVPAD
ncbi:AAA family ATPase [Lysobacter sp. HA35]